MASRGSMGRVALIATLWAGLSPLGALAADYYVAPGGSDQNPGTKERPFATVGKGQERAAPGDTVYIRGGSYNIASGTAVDGILLNKSGQSGRLIKYVAVAGEKPVFDFSRLTAKQRLTGIRVTASYVQVKGLELKGVPQRINTANESWGIYNTGSNNVYEQLDIHHISGPGLFIGGGSNNLVLNCDSHHNYDPLSKAGAGENADGFGCHGSGSNNTFRGCRAWWNTDDGYDFISAKGKCVVERSWAFYNGYMPGTFDAGRNGAGFKAGGYGTGAVPASVPRHTVRFCLAFRNRAAGFYANHHPIGGDWFNNTGYKNARDFDMLVSNGGNPSHALRNNLGYGSSQVITNFTGSNARNNAWQLRVTINDSDFQSVDLRGVDGPRKADGSLPDLGFMKLRAGSDLIDKGNDIGFPFSGAAPDLGWFESGNASAALVEGSAGADDASAAAAEVPVEADADVASDSDVGDVDVDVGDVVDAQSEDAESEATGALAPDLEAQSGSDAGGCSAGGSRESLSTALLMTLALLGLAARRRRA